MKFAELRGEILGDFNRYKYGWYGIDDTVDDETVKDVVRYHFHEKGRDKELYREFRMTKPPPSPLRSTSGPTIVNEREKEPVYLRRSARLAEKRQTLRRSPRLAKKAEMV